MSRTILAATLAAVIALALGATLATGRDHDDDRGSGHRGHAGGDDRGGHHRGHHHRGAKDRGLFAVLNGRNELDANTLRRGAGDPDGRGGTTVLIDGTGLCWGITVTNVSQPVAAHIHEGKRHENGPIVVPLTQPATGDPGASSGCAPVDEGLARDIQRHPHRYYVNVHTAYSPAGAVRGQLIGKRR